MKRFTLQPYKYLWLHSYKYVEISEQRLKVFKIKA